MKKILFTIITILFVTFLQVQAQSVRKLDIGSGKDTISIDAGVTYKIKPNTAGESFEIFKGDNSQGVFDYTNIITTIVGLKLNQNELSLGYGEPFTLLPTIVPTQTITYTSDDDAIASVDATGLITGISKGTTFITAKTPDGQTAVCKVTVKTLPERIADAAGTTDTIIVYGNEEISETIPINIDNTIIKLTTPDDTERILKKTATGYLLDIGGSSVSVKVILDGNVIIQGLATPEYGGTDEINNTASLINVAANAELILKGHSKVTGNAYVVTPSGTNLLGGGITSRGLLVLDEDAQIANNTVCCPKEYPKPWSGSNRNGKAVWGGGVYLTGTSVLEIRGNAKITGNRSINKGGNAFGGAIFPEADGTIINMHGGEISGNSVEASHRASGGAIHLRSTKRFIMTGGVIRDNSLIFGGGGTGVACFVGKANTLILSDSARIVANPENRLTNLREEEYQTITGIPMRKDNGNTVYFDKSNFPARVSGELTGISPVATFDIKKYGTTVARVLGKYDIETNVATDYTSEDPAPIDKFALGSYITTDYETFNLEPIPETKEIEPDGTVTPL